MKCFSTESMDSAFSLPLFCCQATAEPEVFGEHGNAWILFRVGNLLSDSAVCMGVVRMILRRETVSDKTSWRSSSLIVFSNDRAVVPCHYWERRVLVQRGQFILQLRHMPSS